MRAVWRWSIAAVFLAIGLLLLIRATIPPGLYENYGMGRYVAGYFATIILVLLMWEVSAYLSRYFVFFPFLFASLLVIIILSVKWWWYELNQWGTNTYFLWTYYAIYNFLIGATAIIVFLAILSFATHHKLTRRTLTISGIVSGIIVFVISSIMTIYPSLYFGMDTWWLMTVPAILWWAAAFRDVPSLSVFDGESRPTGLSISSAWFGTLLVILVVIGLSMLIVSYSFGVSSWS